jgi:hypothetical protein
LAFPDITESAPIVSAKMAGMGREIGFHSCQQAKTDGDYTVRLRYEPL